MNTTWVRGAALAAGLAVAAAVPGAAWAQEKIRIAGNFSDKHTSSIAIEQFKKDVEAATGGKLIVETFPNMQLGGAQENVTQTRAGTIMMTWVGMAFLSRTVPELEAVSLPFLFPSREVAYKVMDGPVGDELDKKLEDKGFIALGFMELGSRQVTNSVRPIKTMADLKGLKIRLQPNETHLATFRALGANALSMDIKEVYSAMEQKVIDGHENPYNLIYDSRFFEVQKYLSNTGHFFDFIAVVANRKKFQALSPEFQKAHHDGDEQGCGHAARRSGQGRRGCAGRAAEEGHAVRRDAAGRARGDAQGHRGRGRRHQEAHRRRPGRPRPRRGEEGLGLLTGAIPMSRLLPSNLTHHSGPLRPLALGLHALDTVAGWAIIVMLGAMVAVVSLQVLLRYALNSSLGFADELSRLTFVWSIFLGIPLGIRLGSHIGMELLSSRFPPKLQDALARLMAAVAAAMMILVAWQSAVVAFDQWDEMMASMNASAAWFIVAVGVGCGHAALHLVWLVLTGKPTMTEAVATE